MMIATPTFLVASLCVSGVAATETAHSLTEEEVNQGEQQMPEELVQNEQRPKRCPVEIREVMKRIKGSCSSGPEHSDEEGEEQQPGHAQEEEEEQQPVPAQSNNDLATLEELRRNDSPIVHDAISQGDIDKLKYLLDLKAEHAPENDEILNRNLAGQGTALQVAVSNGRLDMVKLLLGDPTVSIDESHLNERQRMRHNEGANTPLHAAILSDNFQSPAERTEVVRLLLEPRETGAANLSRKTAGGILNNIHFFQDKTPLQLAEGKRYVDIEDMLKNAKTRNPWATSVDTYPRHYVMYEVTEDTIRELEENARPAAPFGILGLPLDLSDI